MVMKLSLATKYTKHITEQSRIWPHTCIHTELLQRLLWLRLTIYGALIINGINEACTRHIKICTAAVSKWGLHLVVNLVKSTGGGMLLGVINVLLWSATSDIITVACTRTSCLWRRLQVNKGRLDLEQTVCVYSGNHSWVWNQSTTSRPST